MKRESIDQWEREELGFTKAIFQIYLLSINSRHVTNYDTYMYLGFNSPSFFIKVYIDYCFPFFYNKICFICEEILACYRTFLLSKLQIMCWQVVYCILPLLILVSCFDAVKVSRDCGEDTLVKLGDAKDDDSAVFLQNGHTNRFDLLPE